MSKPEIVSERILELLEKHCLEDNGQLNTDKAKGIILGCLTADLQEECWCGYDMPSVLC